MPEPSKTTKPTSTKDPFQGDRLWVVHIGLNDSIALRALKDGFVCIGWTEMGDLAAFPTREKMRAAMQATWPAWSSAKVRSSFGQVFRFAHKMQEGEAIVFPVRPTRQIAIGRINGPYRFAKDDQELVELDYCNVRPVEWLKTVPRTAFSQDALHSFGSALSVSTSGDHLEEVRAVLRGDQVAPSPEVGLNQGTELADEDAELAPNQYENVRLETEDFLLKQWQRTGFDFEHVVAAVLRAIGYTATVTQKSGDHGVDVIAHPDPLGLQKPYIKVQAKSGTSTVGEPAVNQLKGCLNTGEQGIVVALGGFTSSAEAAARSGGNITLIDGPRFVELFLQHYAELDPEWRARFQLRQVFVPLR
jgi:restriction system protein